MAQGSNNNDAFMGSAAQFMQAGQNMMQQFMQAVAQSQGQGGAGQVPPGLPLNLPAIETYIGHSIPVSKYNPDALMTDLPKPLRLTRARPGNGPRRNGPPRNRRRSG